MGVLATFGAALSSLVTLAQHAGFHVGHGELVKAAWATAADVKGGMAFPDALVKEFAVVIPGPTPTPTPAA